MERAKLLGRSFAELLTIVAGVLLALAVDSCVERRNDRRREASYLSRLEAELRQDSSRIDAGLQFLDGADSALVQLIRLRQGGGAPNDARRFISDLMRARVRGLPGSLSQSTFDDLRGTGALRLIRSSDIRFGMIDHYAGIARRRQILETDYTHYPLALSEVLPGEVQRRVQAGIDIPDTLVAQALVLLARDPGLGRQVTSKRGYLAVQRQGLHATLESGDSLLALLRRRR